MAGYGLPNEQHLSVVLQNNLSLEGHNIESINGSVSGSTSAGGLNIAEWTLSEPGIDLMILCLGSWTDSAALYAHWHIQSCKPG